MYDSKNNGIYRRCFEGVFTIKHKFKLNKLHLSSSLSGFLHDCIEQNWEGEKKFFFQVSFRLLKNTEESGSRELLSVHVFMCIFKELSFW